MSTTVSIHATVVIPTYNRCERLGRVLEALDSQITTTTDGAAFTFDVVVVSDGSTDDTLPTVESLDTSYALQVIQQVNTGAGAARNRGAEAAAGPLLVFLDDDVVPAPGCLRAHVERHCATTDVVVIGPMLTPEDADLSPWVAWEQHQLYKQYARFNEGHPAYARQFYTGNASVSRSAFISAGGFDEAFRRAEDVELAYRLESVGQSFVFEAAAEAYHYAERSIDSWIRTAFDYGRHDVDFSRMGKPHVLGQIGRMFTERHPLQRTLVLATIWSPPLSEAAQRLLLAAAMASNRWGLTRANRLLLSAAYGLSYYRGVVLGLGSSLALYDVLRGRLSGSDFRVVFTLEQTLGHVTHSQNLQTFLSHSPRVEAHFLPVDFSSNGAMRRLPGWSNWTVRAGLRARRSLRQLFKRNPTLRVDAMFVHSQVPAVLLGRWMRRIPTVVSLDATPLQYDELGEFYAHEVGMRFVEQIKHWANRRCFERARHVITWSEWAKQGLVDGYDVSPDDVSVIAPGVDVDRWQTPERSGQAPLRVLFVGGDLERKGGRDLLEAGRRLRNRPGVPEFEIHLVTTSSVSPEPGVFVHGDLGPNSPELVDQYRRADVFCLPTFGDCLPMVLAEAGAAGLPLISTDVGAISELVRDGETGRLINVGDLDGLVRALEDLLSSQELRLEYGSRARSLVEREHDAAANAQHVIEVLRRACTLNPAELATSRMVSTGRLESAGSALD